MFISLTALLWVGPIEGFDEEQKLMFFIDFGVWNSFYSSIVLPLNGDVIF